MKDDNKQSLVTDEIQEAISNLTAIASMDIDTKTAIGVVKGHKIVIGDEAVDYETVEWLVPENAIDLLDNIGYTYKRILEYLKEIYEKEMIDWSDPQSVEGLQAIMVLVGEAADHLNKYLALFHKPQEGFDVTKSKEFKDLQHFYLSTIAKEGRLEGEAAWSDEWAKDKEATSLDLENRGLKDFDTVKLDKEYELFYLKTDEDKSLFTQELLRNIKLYCNFEELGGKDLSSDPLLKVPHLKDRELHFCASEILRDVSILTHDFYRFRSQFSLHGLSDELNKALIALMLSANPKNTIENTTNKTSTQYFDDFLHFLRAALKGDDFHMLLSFSPSERDSLLNLLLKLSSELSFALFTHSSSIQKEVIGFIYYLAELGKERVALKESQIKVNLWDIFLKNEEKIRSLLQFYPNGPLFKILDVINEEEIPPFDAFMQGNIPAKLYDLAVGQKSKHVLHLPSPTHQKFLSKVDINDEFLAYLRHFEGNVIEGGHLLINLQDKTSWKEYVRCLKLEELQKRAEFGKLFTLVTLNKDTEFYSQSGNYFELNHAQDFLEQFEAQLKDAETCGFFFSSKLQNKDFYEFIERALKFTHKYFFAEKNVLTRKARLDFIEIFYNLLLLKIIEIIDPAFISFTCKDGIDAGAAASASFYAFINLIDKKELTKEDKDILHYLFFAPALMVRNRIIDSQRFNRTISSLAHFDFELSNNRSKILKEISKLYKNNYENPS